MHFTACSYTSRSAIVQMQLTHYFISILSISVSHTAPNCMLVTHCSVRLHFKQYLQTQPALQVPDENPHSFTWDITIT